VKILWHYCTLLLMALSLLPATCIARDQYKVDSVHTRVIFEISHAGLSNAIGSFSQIEGLLELDETDWSRSSIKIDIPLSTLHFGNDKWEKKILEKSFFDPEKFPTAHFTSSKIEKESESSGKIYGTLRIKDNNVPIVLEMQLNAIKRHPLTFKKTVGASATATLSRKAFGMTSWQNLIGDEVKVNIQFEAIRVKNEATNSTEENSNAVTQP
jgi:polyisoprenoid-binding protein YceI